MVVADSHVPLTYVFSLPKFINKDFVFKALELQIKMSYNELLEDVIDKTGGCGIYQWITVVSVHAVKLLPVWNYHFMTFAGQTPAMICTSENRAGKSNANVSRKTTENMCLYKNSTECTSFVFEEDMTTLVSEVN